MNLRPLSLSFLIAFLVTVFALERWQNPACPAWLWATLSVLCAAFGYATMRPALRRKGMALLGASTGIAAAVFCVQRTTHVPAPDSVDTLVREGQVTLEGRVRVADIRELSARYTVEAEALVLPDGTRRKAQGKTLVIDKALWPKAGYGDRIAATGRLEKPEAFDGFAYDDYLSASDIYALLRTREMDILESYEGLSPWAVLARARTEVTRRIGALLPEPHASLLDGLLTGNRAAVPEKVLEDFKVSGLTHLLAVSGFNIAIVLSVMSSALFFLPLRLRFVPSVLAVVAFTVFTGASASVVRAAIMGILSLVALHTGRLGDTRLAVLWTAFFMLAANPKYLWYDPSFQLSFLAVIGLIELQPLLANYFSRIPETLGLRDALALTVAAQLYAGAWSALLFGSASLISPISNVFAAPLVPVSMLVGSLALLADAVIHPLGQVLAAAVWLLLELLLGIGSLSARIPFASVPVPAMGAWGIAAYYAGLYAVTRRLRRPRDPMSRREAPPSAIRSSAPLAA